MWALFGVKFRSLCGTEGRAKLARHRHPGESWERLMTARAPLPPEIPAFAGVTF